MQVNQYEKVDLLHGVAFRYNERATMSMRGMVKTHGRWRPMGKRKHKRAVMRAMAAMQEHVNECIDAALADILIETTPKHKPWGESDWSPIVYPELTGITQHDIRILYFIP